MSYSDLINVDDFEKKEYFSQERWDVSFYCKDCKKLVETDRPNPNWYTFICHECEWKNIVIWTEEWLKTNYKIK
jgi:Zn finger protein HypA/HybF involved in hydrogenase expression